MIGVGIHLFKENESLSISPENLIIEKKLSVLQNLVFLRMPG
jgi:hypothetical protein